MERELKIIYVCGRFPPHESDLRHLERGFPAGLYVCRNRLITVTEILEIQADVVLVHLLGYENAFDLARELSMVGGFVLAFLTPWPGCELEEWAGLPGLLQLCTPVTSERAQQFLHEVIYEMKKRNCDER